MNKFLGGLCFVIGLLLMGSDGSWFPWINFFGCIIFSLTLYFAKEVTK